MERILVTGGSGFIGSNLVRRLVHEGYDVRVFDNGFRGDLRRLTDVEGYYRLYTGDIRNMDAVAQAVRGVDCIFHLACVNGTRHFYEMPETVLDIAVRGALNTLEAASQHHIQKYILASSSEVYQEPTTIPTPETERAIIPDIKNPRYSYAGGKLISELLAIHMGNKFGLNPMIFRPHNIYGPDMGREHVIPEFIIRMSELVKSSEGTPIDFPIQGSGRETRSFCYIDDLVDGLLIVLRSGQSGEIYHIGHDGEEIAMGELAQRIADLMKIQINMIQTPLRPGGTSRRCPDIQRLRELGYTPKVHLEEGLQKTIEWYISHPV